jgi:hypothetical protein
MKEAVITISDELAEALEAYRRDYADPSDLAAIAGVALQSYLQERGYLLSSRPLRITPAQTGSGKTDVSREHDRELAGE